jgi:hypothetical protein
MFMKILIPYILSYLIVASGTALYWHFRHTNYTNSISPKYVIVNTTLSHDDLAAKLQQVGLSAQNLQTVSDRPLPLASLALHFLIFAVYFAAFVGLKHFFQRIFRTDVSDTSHAA